MGPSGERLLESNADLLLGTDAAAAPVI